MNIFNLVRQNIQKLTPYLSARRAGGKGEIYLNANESPCAEAYSLRFNDFNRYPECQPSELIAAYAKYADVLSSQIVVTRGADEAIELVMQAFCEPSQDEIMYCSPTYDMYRVNAEKLGIQTNTIPFNADWTVNLSLMEQQLTNVKLIYLCNPNNPTGSLISPETIEKILLMAQGKSIVVVDEAYIDFAIGNSVVSLLKQYPHLIILRTLSKAFALAGLRCGFLLASEDIVSVIMKVIAPYPIALPVADIATQALMENGLAAMQRNVQAIIQNRETLKQGLAQCACVNTVFDSDANFLLVKLNDKEAVLQYLLSQGVLARDQKIYPTLSDCVRVTIGTKAECQRLVDVLMAFQ